MFVARDHSERQTIGKPQTSATQGSDDLASFSRSWTTKLQDCFSLAWLEIEAEVVRGELPVQDFSGRGDLLQEFKGTRSLEGKSNVVHVRNLAQRDTSRNLR